MKNNGIVKGVVKDHKGKPQEGATVQIDNTQLIAVTDRQGEYCLSEVPSGQQSVTANMVIAKATKVVDIPCDGAVEVDFIINPLQP